MTKVYLQSEMVQLHCKHRRANTKLFVDDTSMQTTGQTYEEIASVLRPAVVDFAKAARNLKLPLSPKAVICASKFKFAAELSNELSRYGIKFVVAKATRDLGITHSAATTRPKEQLRARLAKAKKRILKVSRIARISRKARKLFSGSAFSAATWGHQGSALTEHQILTLERDALASSGIKAAGRCRTIALAVCYGVLGTLVRG